MLNVKAYLIFDLQIFRGLLEPIFTLDDLQQQPQPISMLFQLCHKHNKRLAIRYLKEGKRIIAGVYLDDELFASGSAENKDSAKLLAAKEALGKFSECTPIAMVVDEGSVEVEVEDAKRKLYEICSKKKWPKPIYRYKSYHDPKFNIDSNLSLVLECYIFGKQNRFAS